VLPLLNPSSLRRKRSPFFPRRRKGDFFFFSRLFPSDGGPLPKRLDDRFLLSDDKESGLFPFLLLFSGARTRDDTPFFRLPLLSRWRLPVAGLSPVLFFPRNSTYLYHPEVIKPPALFSYFSPPPQGEKVRALFFEVLPPPLLGQGARRRSAPSFFFFLIRIKNESCAATSAFLFHNFELGPSRGNVVPFFLFFSLSRGTAEYYAVLCFFS